MMRLTCCSVMLAVVSTCLVAAEPRPTSNPDFELRITRARKIYSDGCHNAFTGMSQFQGRTFITFRSAVNHMTFEGKIRIIASDDLEHWQPVHLAERADTDFRDPKLVTFGGRLLCYFAERQKPTPGSGETELVSMVVRSGDGLAWEKLTDLPTRSSNETYLDFAPDSSHEHKIDVPIGFQDKDPAYAEHTTAADIFLADVSYTPYWPVAK